MSASSKNSGSMPSAAGVRANVGQRGAARDSFMTSPSWPVSVRLALARHRRWPRSSAPRRRPASTPARARRPARRARRLLVLEALAARAARAPRSSQLARGVLPSAMLLRGLRAAGSPSSRSRLRSPASRVYSRITRRIASSVIVSPEHVEPVLARSPSGSGGASRSRASRGSV